MQIFQKTSNIVMSYVLITFGILMYTFGWSALMLPAKIIGGGVSGMSSIINLGFGLPIPIGIINLVINGVLLAIGFKVLGSQFGLNTIYGIVISSLCFIFWQQGMHIENLFVEDGKLGFDPFMCAVMGGALCGGGIGLAFAMGGNTGGTDIIALILSKYYNISPGKVIMYLDIIIIGCSYFISGNLVNIVYGYIVMVTMTYVLDLVVDGNKQTYQIMVFSAKTPEIGESVTKEVGRGATLLNAEGCYSHTSQQVLVIMSHRTDKQHIMKIVHRIDPNAFITVSKAQGVYGKNFEKLKM